VKDLDQSRPAVKTLPEVFKDSLEIHLVGNLRLANAFSFSPEGEQGLPQQHRFDVLVFRRARSAGVRRSQKHRVVSLTKSLTSRFAEDTIWSSSSRDGPGGVTASWVPTTSMIRSTTPGRAMTSCGNASIDLSSVEAPKRSASYIVATRSALAMRANQSGGGGAGRPSINALNRRLSFERPEQTNK
jgi:hypothetical protein